MSCCPSNHCHSASVTADTLILPLYSIAELCTYCTLLQCGQARSGRQKKSRREGSRSVLAVQDTIVRIQSSTGDGQKFELSHLKFAVVSYMTKVLSRRVSPFSKSEPIELKLLHQSYLFYSLAPIAVPYEYEYGLPPALIISRSTVRNAVGLLRPTQGCSTERFVVFPAVRPPAAPAFPKRSTVAAGPHQEEST
jgi:hypothetical protein